MSDFTYVRSADVLVLPANEPAALDPPRLKNTFLRSEVGETADYLARAVFRSSTSFIPNDLPKRKR